MECSRLWLVRMGSGRLPSLVLADELVVMGQIQIVVRIGELHFVSWIVVVVNLFPRVDY